MGDAWCGGSCGGVYTTTLVQYAPYLSVDVACAGEYLVLLVCDITTKVEHLAQCELLNGFLCILLVVGRQCAMAYCVIAVVVSYTPFPRCCHKTSRGAALPLMWMYHHETDLLRSKCLVEGLQGFQDFHTVVNQAVVGCG